MKKVSLAANRVLSRFQTAQSMGVVLAETTSDKVDGRQMEINNQSLTSYASCSYLGLDQDERMKAAAVAAIEAYGTYFSTSRSYLQMGEYVELEAKLSQVFGAPTLVAPTTTLAHFSVMPVVVSTRDAIIIDYQAHNSLQDATIYMKGRGAHREVVPHNDMLTLRERIAKLSVLHDQVWYVFDGVYSIYGDVAPFDEIAALLEEFDNLYLYCDDAHGMGWAGKHGRGYALDQMPMHERMVLVTSLNKAVASGGGAIVLPSEQLRDVVRVTGKTLTFSGPIPPAGLASALVCADILLSDEIYELQHDLNELCKLFRDEATAAGLTIVDDSVSPVFYVGIGDLPTLFTVAKLLQEEYGIFVTPTGYPAVPFNKCGVRVTLTRTHTREQVLALVRGLDEMYQQALQIQGVDEAEMMQRFAGGVLAATEE